MGFEVWPLENKPKNGRYRDKKAGGKSNFLVFVLAIRHILESHLDEGKENIIVASFHLSVCLEESERVKT